MSEKIKSIAGIVGHNIQFRRKKRNLTQEELAEMVGIGQQSLSRMEKGKIAPRLERLQDFAEALGCVVVDLFEENFVEDDEPISALKAVIKPLSEDSQQAVINIASETARAMLKLEKSRVNPEPSNIGLAACKNRKKLVT
jgi:transcriptional regulator with XRE-family HTH domain